jgi:hypothetical protein
MPVRTRSAATDRQEWRLRLSLVTAKTGFVNSIDYDALRVAIVSGAARIELTALDQKGSKRSRGPAADPTLRTSPPSCSASTQARSSTDEVDEFAGRVSLGGVDAVAAVVAISHLVWAVRTLAHRLCSGTRKPQRRIPTSIRWLRRSSTATRPNRFCSAAIRSHGASSWSVWANTSSAAAS